MVDLSEIKYCYSCGSNMNYVSYRYHSTLNASYKDLKDSEFLSCDECGTLLEVNQKKEFKFAIYQWNTKTLFRYSYSDVLGNLSISYTDYADRPIANMRSLNNLIDIKIKINSNSELDDMIKTYCYISKYEHLLPYS